MIIETRGLVSICRNELLSMNSRLFRTKTKTMINGSLRTLKQSGWQEGMTGWSAWREPRGCCISVKGSPFIPLDLKTIRASPATLVYIGHPSPIVHNQKWAAFLWHLSKITLAVVLVLLRSMAEDTAGGGVSCNGASCCRESVHAREPRYVFIFFHLFS